MKREPSARVRRAVLSQEISTLCAEQARTRDPDKITALEARIAALRAELAAMGRRPR
jgi:uncharacterized small protein (DUF1192 family)